MIRYNLQCRHGHQFLEWFSNSQDYDQKAATQEIHCPTCQDNHIRKMIMAPNLSSSSSALADSGLPSCGQSGFCQGGCGFAGQS